MSLRCSDCRCRPWAEGEDFYVLKGLWHLVIPRSKWGDVICIGCFEKRLGRKLEKKDFARWFRNNRWWGNRYRKVNHPPSERLSDRLQLMA